MLSERLSRMLRANALRWPWPAERKPLVVEHVRYVKKPVIDPVTKAIAMAKSMGRADLVARLER